MKKPGKCSVILAIALFLVSASVPAGIGEGELIAAAGSGNISQVKLLLSKGVNVNARDDEGTTALITAARNGYEFQVCPFSSPHRSHQ